VLDVALLVGGRQGRGTHSRESLKVVIAKFSV
jgi:hypothetical protein